MTTIAYRDGILASDRLACRGDLRIGRVTKIVRFPGPSLAPQCRYAAMAIAGRLGLITPVYDWVRAGCPRGEAPDLGDDTGVLLVTAHGEVSYWDDGDAVEPPLDGEFFARGSGRDFAMAAMACGRSAVQAIRVAARLDIHTGGGVDWVNVLTGEAGTARV